MNNKLLILIIISILAITGLIYAWVWFDKNKTSEIADKLKSEEPLTTSEPLPRNSENSADKGSTQRDQKPPSIWEKKSSNASPDSIIGIPRPSDDSVLLDLSRLRAANPVAGDALFFDIPQNRYAFSVVISEIKEQQGGITILKSEPDQNITNYVTIILGQKNTLGNFFTPAGEYELIGNLEIGWLVPASSLPGPSENDYVAEKDPTMLQKPPPIARPLPLRD